MVYIKYLDISGFKSFKKVHIEFSRGITAIMGPNGSGKSNIVDAIMFVLGETSLSRLRANKLENLVNKNSKVATVSITLEDEKKELQPITITRQIRKDGKTRVTINDKKVNIKELKKTLLLLNIGNIKNAIIPQGEIQRILKMKPKERKYYLEELADTAIYTLKREEALKELETVNNKIREVNIMLGERLGLLNQLENDIKKLEQYENIIKERNNIKGTLIKKQIESLNESLSMQVREIEEKSKEKEELEKKLENINKDIEYIDKKRNELDKELIKLKEIDEIFKKLEEKKASLKIISSNISLIEDKKAQIEQMLKDIEQEIIITAEKYKDLEHIKIDESEQLQLDEIAKIEQKIDNLEQQKEDKLRLIEQAKKMEERANILKSLNISQKSDEIINIDEINKKLNEALEKEKELNAKLINIDNQLISLREKYAITKASASASISNALLLVDELKKTEKVKGIYGRVIDLIEFPEELANAIDAAAGLRLSYVVVENTDVAKQVIEILKKTQSGRLTFLPLKEFSYDQKVKEKNAKLLINFIEYNPAYENIVKYVFGNTILADNFDEGKKLAKHYDRVVTLTGELFEKSGAITGGASKTSIAMSKTSEEIAKRIESLKEEKAYMLNQLNELREVINSLRYQKAKLQAKEEEIKAREQEIKRQQELIAELREIEKWLEENKTLLDKTHREVEKIENEINELKNIKKETEEKFKKELEAALEKKIRMKVKLEEKINIEMTLARLNEKKQNLIEQLKNLEQQERIERDKMLLTESSISKLEDEASIKYKELESFIEELKKLDIKQQELGKSKSEIEKKIYNIDKYLTNLEISKASIDERLKLLNEELIKIGEFQFLNEIKQSELEKRLEEIENELKNIGQINFSAKEVYDQYSKGVAEIKEKVEMLKEEKKAVMDLISDIDKRKKEAFLNAFNTLNEKFKELIGNIKGFSSGELILKGENPDEAELHIVLYQDNKPVYVDSLAGGEKTLLSLFFLYAVNSVKPSSFYIFDEADAALDKINCERMMEFLRHLSNKTQFIIISHRDPSISKADSVIGVSKENNFSKVVMVALQKAS